MTAPAGPTAGPTAGPVAAQALREPLVADDDWQHAVRGLLTVAVGEVELVLADDGTSPQARSASAARVLEALAAVEELLSEAADAADPAAAADGGRA